MTPKFRGFSMRFNNGRKQTAWFNKQLVILTRWTIVILKLIMLIILDQQHSSLLKALQTIGWSIHNRLCSSLVQWLNTLLFIMDFNKKECSWNTTGCSLVGTPFVPKSVINSMSTRKGYKALVLHLDLSFKLPTLNLSPQSSPNKP